MSSSAYNFAHFDFLLIIFFLYYIQKLSLYNFENKLNLIRERSLYLVLIFLSIQFWYSNTSSSSVFASILKNIPTLTFIGKIFLLLFWNEWESNCCPNPIKHRQKKIQQKNTLMMNDLNVSNHFQKRVFNFTCFLNHKNLE